LPHVAIVLSSHYSHIHTPASYEIDIGFLNKLKLLKIKKIGAELGSIGRKV
jgi:hypothetical protein